MDMRQTIMSPMQGQWSPPRSSTRMVVLNPSMLHIVGVPLLLLAAIGVGFCMVILKEVLLPFIIAVFFTFLLRPLVNLLTTPFGRVFPCCATPILTNSGRSRSRNGGYARLNAPNRAAGGASDAGDDAAISNNPPRRPRAPSPAKFPRTFKGWWTRIFHNASDLYKHRSGNAAPSSGRQGHNHGPLGHGQSHAGASAAGGAHARRSGSPQPSDVEYECACCCGWCRITRCPRWFAVLISLCVAMSVLGGLILMIADAIQRFQQESLGVFVDEASVLVDKLQKWLSMFGIHLEGAAILEAIKQQISVPFLVQTTVTVVVDGVGNALLVLLLVLYLLAEASAHAPGSLRAKVDDQIQRYIGIKTIISAFQGLVVYLIMGTVLHVRMAHLFGVLHFLLNYIPTAGPIIATLVPLPIILLDPDLSVTAKVAAFAGPTAVHMVVGNFLEPLVFGSSMELHPVTVLLALALWYALWGIPGAILAVPITAVMRIIMVHIDHPYAAIVICVLEGRLSAAMEDVNSALEQTTMGVEGDLESVPGTAYRGGSATGGTSDRGGPGSNNHNVDGIHGDGSAAGTGLVPSDGTSTPLKGGAGHGRSNSYTAGGTHSVFFMHGHQRRGVALSGESDGSSALSDVGGPVISISTAAATPSQYGSAGAGQQGSLIPGLGVSGAGQGAPTAATVHSYLTAAGAVGVGGMSARGSSFGRNTGGVTSSQQQQDEYSDNSNAPGSGDRGIQMSYPPNSGAAAAGGPAGGRRSPSPGQQYDLTAGGPPQSSNGSPATTPSYHGAAEQRSHRDLAVGSAGPNPGPPVHAGQGGAGHVHLQRSGGLGGSARQLSSSQQQQQQQGHSASEGLASAPAAAAYR